MPFFRKRVPRNHILNAFRISDMAYARAFDGVHFIESIIEELARLTGERPTRYEANYEKEWKTWDGFTRGVARLPGLARVWLSYGAEGLCCEYRNTLVGFRRPPNLGSIDIVVSVPESLASLEQLIEVARSVYRLLPFDYGYAHALGTDYLPGHEVKRRKTLFGNEVVRVDKAASVWLYHMAGVRHGCLRSVYELNFLNASHLSNAAVRSTLDRGLGTVEAMNDRLSIWAVPERDISAAIAALGAAGLIIGHDAGREEFLKQPYAAQFYAAMSTSAGGV